jgi:hypothetical protein
MKRKYVPILERDSWNFENNIDKELSDKRSKQSQLKKQVEEMEQCTFHPETGSSAEAHTVDELIQWGRIKKANHATQRLKNLQDAKVYSFRPAIGERSRELTRERSKEKCEERLLNYGKEKKVKLAQRRVDSLKGLFRPSVNRKSKELLKRKGSKEREMRVIVPNGESKTCRFFHAKKRKVPNEEPEKNRVTGRSRERIRKRQRLKEDKRRVKSKDNYYFKGTTTSVSDISKFKPKKEPQKPKPAWDGDFNRKPKPKPKRQKRRRKPIEDPL